MQVTNKTHGFVLLSLLGHFTDTFIAYTLYCQAPTSPPLHQKHKDLSFVYIWYSCQEKSPTANKTRCMQMHFYLLSLAHPFFPIYRVVFFPAPLVILWWQRQMEGLYGEQLTSTRGAISMCLLHGCKLLQTATGGLCFSGLPFCINLSLHVLCLFPRKNCHYLPDFISHKNPIICLAYSHSGFLTSRLWQITRTQFAILQKWISNTKCFATGEIYVCLECR